MPATTASVDPQGQPQTEGESGQTQPQDGSTIGFANNRGTYQDPQKNKQVQKEETKIETPIATPEAEAQPTNKDERHAARKITELSEEKVNYARLAVEGNADAIYAIAQTDPKLAEKLLQEYEYDTESVEELLARRQNPEADPAQLQEKIENNSRIQELESRLLDETVKRLAKDYPDLKDSLEEEFRNMYSNPTFAKYNEEQKLNIARAALGIVPQGPSNETLLAMLKQQEGSITSPKGGMSEKKTPKISPQDAQIYRAAGVDESKLAKYLPDDIDEQIAQMFAGVRKD